MLKPNPLFIKCNSYSANSATCVWNEWQIGTCSKTCGGGIRTNTRTKKKKESIGTVCKGKSKVEEACNTQDCQGKVIYVKHSHT